MPSSLSQALPPFRSYRRPAVQRARGHRWPTDRFRLLVTGTRKSRQHGVHVNDATPRRTPIGPEPPARSRSENIATEPPKSEGRSLAHQSASEPAGNRSEFPPTTLPAAQRHPAGHRIVGNPAGPAPVEPPHALGYSSTNAVVPRRRRRPLDPFAPESECRARIGFSTAVSVRPSRNISWGAGRTRPRRHARTSRSVQSPPPGVSSATSPRKRCRRRSPPSSPSRSPDARETRPGLRLDDIDWRGGTIEVRTRKSRNRRRMAKAGMVDQTGVEPVTS